MTNTTTTFDFDLDFSEASRSAYVSERLKPTGEGELVKAVVKKVSLGETGPASANPGTIQFIFDIAPLDSAGRALNKTVRLWVPIPKRNPMHHGHKISDLYAKTCYTSCVNAIRAFGLGADLPVGPTKTEDGRYISATGEEMTKEDWATYEEAKRSVVDSFLEKWFSPDKTTGQRGCVDLVGTELFCTLKADQTGKYVNLGFARSDAGSFDVVGAELEFVD